MNKKPISREDYACLLARSYALALGRSNSRLNSLFGDPFRKELDKEAEAIRTVMSEYECLENEVIERVRELVPVSNWDKSIRKACKELDEAIKTNNYEKLSELTDKLEMYNNDSNWQTKERLNDLYENS